MPEPAIVRGSEHFFNVLYEGNGAGQRVGKFLPFTNNGTIAKSLILNDADNAYLQRTNDAGDRDTFTVSFWVKRGHLSGNINQIFDTYDGSSTNDGYIRFNADNTLSTRIGSPSNHLYTTNRTFEDTSIWYHIVLSVNTNDSTADDRVKLYVNGDLITSFSSRTNPGQGDNTQFNYNSANFRVGSTTGGNYDFDGYIAEFNLVDGSALAPSTFGLTDTSTGRWIPKTLTGITYGTNGHRLEFANSAGQTIGDDTSGNTNDFSVTNSVVGDITTDSPTQNFPTFSVAGPQSGSVQSTEEGNLKIVMTAGSGYPTVRTLKEIPQSGKWYWEVKADQVSNIVGLQNATYGVLDLNMVDIPGLDANQPFTRQIGGMGVEGSSGIIFTGLLTSAGKSATSFTLGSTNIGDNDYIVFAFDMDDGKAWWGWNDSSAGSSIVWLANDGGSDGNPATGANPTVTFNPADHRFVPAQGGFAPGGSDGAGGTYASNFIYNFGSKSFAFTAPTGFSGLSQDNFENKGDKDLADFVWIKNRDQSDTHALYDSSRGALNEWHISEDVPAAVPDGLTKFLKGGFAVEDDVTVNSLNESYAAWCWHANGGTTAANTAGSGANVATTVQANQTAGFSICEFTGTGSNLRFAHGLSQAPEWIIIKRLEGSGAAQQVYHVGYGADKYVQLNEPDALVTTGAATTNFIETPTATYVDLGSNSNSNNSGDKSVAYCWHSVDGFSKFGSYEGNGNADGVFVYTGFKPAWIMFKEIDNSNDWPIWDNARFPSNPTNNSLFANLSQADNGSSIDLDVLSNGFKCRTTNTQINRSSSTYIFMAFAEHPFIGDGTNPATAR